MTCLHCNCDHAANRLWRTEQISLLMLQRFGKSASRSYKKLPAPYHADWGLNKRPVIGVSSGSLRPRQAKHDERPAVEQHLDADEETVYPKTGVISLVLGAVALFGPSFCDLTEPTCPLRWPDQIQVSWPD